MSKVFDYFNQRDEEQPETALCDGDCGNVYYLDDLNQSCYDDLYCNSCMFTFINEQERREDVSDRPPES